MRTSQITRDTAETKIRLTLDIDGSGRSEIDTGCGFLNHMLTLFARHGRFDLALHCEGDTEVDYHHTAEDIGIALGCALKEALGEKRGIVRYGSQLLPMDEALILAAVDISGRGYLAYDMQIPTQKVGDFDTELVEEFFLGLTRKAELTLHLRQISGSNSHHIIEGCFKAFARALAAACRQDTALGNEIPSTKGVL